MSVSVADAGATLSLARDDERLLTGVDDGTTTDGYGYDDNDRLTSALGRTYTYDDGDDLTQTATAAGAPVTLAYDDAGQLTTSSSAGITAATFTYNDNGQRTAMTPASGPATTYGWTRSGQLASFSVAGGSVDESYTYDGDGLRQTKTTSGSRTHEAWDVSSGTPLMIADGPTAYVTGPGGLPVEQITAGGTVRWFSHDQHGSTTALTNASGTTVQSYKYDAYGQLTSATPTVENPFQYAGQYTDAATGLQYLRARYYDPSTGQFLSRDPIEDQTFEPYAYAGNNPANAIDPSGLFGIGDAWDAGKEILTRGAEGALGEADGIASVLTFGKLSVSEVLGIDTDCLGPSYAIGRPFGVTVGLMVPVERAVAGVRYLKDGREIKIGNNVRIAPGGNRTGHAFGRFPHYHRRVVDPATGQTVPGGGISRHRPWETKSTDKSFWDRF